MVSIEEYLSNYRELSRKVKKGKHYVVTVVVGGGEYTPQAVVMRLVFPLHSSFFEVRRGVAQYAERLLGGV